MKRKNVMIAIGVAVLAVAAWMVFSTEAEAKQDPVTFRGGPVQLVPLAVEGIAFPDSTWLDFVLDGVPYQLGLLADGTVDVFADGKLIHNVPPELLAAFGNPTTTASVRYCIDWDGQTPDQDMTINYSTYGLDQLHDLITAYRQDVAKGGGVFIHCGPQSAANPNANDDPSQAWMYCDMACTACEGLYIPLWHCEYGPTPEAAKAAWVAWSHTVCNVRICNCYPPYGECSS
jgi:hypothetical protein